MCNKCIHIYNASKEYLNGLPPIFKQAMQDLHSGKITPNDLHPNLVTAIARELLKGVNIGYDTSPSSTLTKPIEENIYVFSGFKTYQQLKEASLLMHNADGAVKPFSEFYKEVSVINKTYNQNYLEAEYNHAVACGQMASNWEDIQSKKEVGSLLKYQTSEDDRVRPAHAAINNVVRPVDDPFWDTYYPPNGWNCRCDVIQLLSGDEPISTEYNSPTLPTMFKNNVGKDGVIFPETHPYYDVCSLKNRVVSNQSCVDKTIAIKKRSLQIQKIVNYQEYLKQILSLPKNKQYTAIQQNKKGGKVLLHKLVNTSKSDYQQVLSAAKLLAKQGHIVEILPVVTDKELRAVVLPGVKFNFNPDLRIKEIYYDVKAPLVNNIGKRINEGFKQAEVPLIILTAPISEKYLWKITNNVFKLEQNKELKYFIIMEKGKLRTIDRTFLKQSRQ